MVCCPSWFDLVRVRPKKFNRFTFFFIFHPGIFVLSTFLRSQLIHYEFWPILTVEPSMSRILFFFRCPWQGVRHPDQPLQTLLVFLGGSGNSSQNLIIFCGSDFWGLSPNMVFSDFTSSWTCYEPDSWLMITGSFLSFALRIGLLGFVGIFILTILSANSRYRLYLPQ